MLEVRYELSQRGCTKRIGCVATAAGWGDVVGLVDDQEVVAARVARLARARLVSAGGDEQDRFLAGAPFALEVALTGAVPAPSLHLELRDGSGLLVAEEVVDTASLGWDERDGGLELRLDVPAPPLEFGRFELGLALLGQDGRLLDRLPRGLSLLVYPDGESRGLVRLEGTWRAEAKDALP